MRESTFKQACRLVDEQIKKDGVEVSVVDRNRRVLAVDHQLRHGMEVNPKAEIRVISAESILSDSGKDPA